MTKIAMAYQSNHPPNSSLQLCIGLGIVVSIVFMLTLFHSDPQSHLTRYFMSPRESVISCLTWNIAAVNNNPFEYWITNKDPAYNNMMKNVSAFIQKPGKLDVLVKDVVKDSIVMDLLNELTKVGWSGINETKQLWNKDFRNRKIITQYIQDGLLGKKRLMSMPDRLTNTISMYGGVTVFRPTVINCYNGRLDSIDKWWAEWKQFMFRDKIEMKSGLDGKKSVRVIDMIAPIKKAKYPSITEAEEKISLPLQVLCLAIFDAILVHMMRAVALSQWQDLRHTMCERLNRKKNDRTLEILERTYGGVDIQFLQEVGSSFSQAVHGRMLAQLFDIHFPAEVDGDRDQNSVILTRKGMMKDVVEVSGEVMNVLKAVNAKAPVMSGDLLALTAVDASTGTKYILASFHGDTNGLATVPIVTAVHDYAVQQKPDHKLIFGMDANTYAKPESDQQGVESFAKFYVSKKLNTCYGPNPNPLNYTTFHARTHLQPQLNKAVNLEERNTKGDKNPKDFIMFFASDFSVLGTVKDNTGEKRYIDNMVFPTLEFPSDHGVTSTYLRELSTPASTITPRSRVMLRAG